VNHKIQRYSNEPVATQKYWTDSAFPGDITIYGGAAAAERVAKAVHKLGDDVFIHDARPVIQCVERHGNVGVVSESVQLASGEVVAELVKWTLVPAERKMGETHSEYFVRTQKIDRNGKKIVERVRVPAPKPVEYCACPPPRRGELRLQLDSYPARCCLCRKVLP
jgi:hypothetical protein